MCYLTLVIYRAASLLTAAELIQWLNEPIWDSEQTLYTVYSAPVNTYKSCYGTLHKDKQTISYKITANSIWQYQAVIIL